MPVRRTMYNGGQNSPQHRGIIKRKFPPLLRRIVTLAVAGVALFCLAYGGFIFAGIPDPSKLGEQKGAESTKIFDRTGTNVLYEFGDIRRTWKPINEISPFLRDATVAVEDKDFYKHGGISIRGIMRALWADIRGKSLQGGSTITQQLIKQTMLTPEQTITRKAREAILAIEVDKKLTKEKILETYLNVTPYGSNTSGVESASQSFFGTSAKDLSLAQAALLAALPKAPTYYSPFGSHTDSLFARQKYVLDQMADQGYIKKEEAEAAKQVKLTFKSKADRISAPHFVFYVREQLEKEFGTTLANEGGLKITTTLDYKMQRAAEDAVAAQAPKNVKRGAKNAAFVAIDPKNGDILSMVGSVDYFDTENDGNVNVSIRPRSPGSSFKPITYAQLLIKGFTTETVLADVPIDFGTPAKPYRPLDYDKKFRGPVTLRQALSNSLNIPAVEALYMAGLNDTLALAQKMGLATLTDGDRYGLSLVLGGGEVRLLDMVSAYSVFATEGIQRPSRPILKIESSSGRVIYDATKTQVAENRVLDTEVARQITDVLSDNNARGLVFGTNSPLQLGPRPVAAKTGTAQDYTDGWTIGYTPSIVAGVWVGNNDNTKMNAIDGVVAAAPIWNSFMRTVLAGTPVENFNKPKPIKTDINVLNGKLPTTKLRYDRASGTILPADCSVPIGKSVDFISFHSPLYFLNKDSPLDGPPNDLGSDPMFAKWEAGVATWREQYNKEHPDDSKMYVDKIPDVSCDPGLLENQPKISFTSPVDEIIRNSPLKVSVQIEAPSRVTKVEFFANDQKIGERTSEPWEVLYKFASAQMSGQVVLKARATTEEGKVGQGGRTIQINPGADLPKVSLFSPWADATLTAVDFPFSIKANVSDKSGIKSVEALLRSGDKIVSIGATDKDTGGGLYEIMWRDMPGPGKYILWILATGNNNKKAQTSPINITIP